MRQNTLGNPAVRRRFELWVQQSLLNPDDLSRVDWRAEFGDDLTFGEAVDMALYKFPTLWREDVVQGYHDRVKQIVFIKPLISKLLNEEIQVTYRKTPKYGYYYVIDNRFRPYRDLKIIIEFYHTEMVDPYHLSDDDARLAGVETAEEIHRLFRKWYGDPIPNLFCNWFKLKSP